MRRFVDCFSEHFETEFSRRRLSQQKPSNGTITSVEEESDYAVDHSDVPKPTKPFFRRLSFKGLKKGKVRWKKKWHFRTWNCIWSKLMYKIIWWIFSQSFVLLQALFHKHSLEENDPATRQNKTKMSNIVVECRKVGEVMVLTPESLDQPSESQKWEKCKLALVKTAGGYLLEFYSPPSSKKVRKLHNSHSFSTNQNCFFVSTTITSQQQKSFFTHIKPRSGVFCFLISDVRETTALEMPSRENTFVIKADSSTEYVIEAANPEEMRSWLATIRYCMRSTPTFQLPGSIDTQLTAFPNLTTMPASPPQLQSDGLFHSQSTPKKKTNSRISPISQYPFLFRCNGWYNGDVTQQQRNNAKQYDVTWSYRSFGRRTNIHIQ